MSGNDKGLSGKIVGLKGVRIGSVVAADRPKITETDEGFLCGDGSGGLVYKTSSATRTLTNSGAAIAVTDSTASTNSTTGSLKTAGGLGVAGAVNVGTYLAVAGTTASSSSTTGALKSAGGLGVAGAANIGTNLAVEGNTDSSSSTTGSLKTAGGLGVALKATAGTGFYAPLFKDATANSGVDATSTTANISAAGTVVVKTASNALGFFSATTPVAKQTGAGTLTTGFVSATGADVLAGSTFTGNVGSTTYTISEIVAALKNYGLLVS
jgi:hypothetical protein